MGGSRYACAFSKSQRCPSQEDWHNATHGKKANSKKWRKREIAHRATDRESSHTIQKRCDTRDAKRRNAPFETSKKPYGKQQFHVTCAKRLAATEARDRKRTPKREGRYPESPYDARCSRRRYRLYEVRRTRVSQFTGTSRRSIHRGRRSSSIENETNRT